MPSFDVVLEADMTEVKNAVEQSQKEIGTRFDFKGTGAAVEQKERELTVTADSDFQLQQVREVLIGKLGKRKVDVRFLDDGDIKESIRPYAMGRIVDVESFLEDYPCDPDGGELWTRQLGTSAADSPNSIVVTAGGQVIVSG